MIWFALAACTLPLPNPDDPALVAEPVTVQDLWAEALDDNQELTLESLVVTSPATADGTTFYVQQAGGGPASGLQVEIGEGILGWPPPVGTPIALTGTWVQYFGRPTLWLADRADLEVTGPAVAPVVAPWSEDPTLVWGLVAASEVAITSAVDPAGRADTSLGQQLFPLFDVPTPGWNRAGDLVGIQGINGVIHLRTEADWTGAWEGDAPLEVALTEVAGLTDGTPVLVRDCAQATRWSRTERYAVIQDAAGNGLWVDTEGFGWTGTVATDVADWVGEVRSDGDGLRLRVWEPPALTGAVRDQLLWTGDPELAPVGAILTSDVTGLQSIGARGDRACDQWLLDNRVRFLGDLTDPDRVRGALRDEAELRRLVVLDRI